MQALRLADKRSIGGEVANCYPTANEKVVKWEIQNLSGRLLFAQKTQDGGNQQKKCHKKAHRVQSDASDAS